MEQSLSGYLGGGDWCLGVYQCGTGVIGSFEECEVEAAGVHTGPEQGQRAALLGRFLLQ